MSWWKFGKKDKKIEVTDLIEPNKKIVTQDTLSGSKDDMISSLAQVRQNMIIIYQDTGIDLANIIATTIEHLMVSVSKQTNGFWKSQDDIEAIEEQVNKIAAIDNSKQIKDSVRIISELKKRLHI